jgi:SAM-dependent methyltransferase
MPTNVVLRKARSAFIKLRRNIVSARFGASPDRVYSSAFYDGGGFAQTEETAAAMTSYLIQRFNPRSVLDLGCGMGHYLKHFAANGCRAVGVEGSAVGLARIPDAVVAMQHDLRKPLIVNQRFDLVMSVEVAEHVPKKYSRNLVRSLCRHSNGLIVFTAAPPGTPGDDHINCRERGFWDALFDEQGYEFNQEESRSMMEFARASGVARWFQEWAYIYTPIEHANA